MHVVSRFFPYLEGKLMRISWPFARKNSYCFWPLANFIEMPCIAMMGMATVMHAFISCVDQEFATHPLSHSVNISP